MKEQIEPIQQKIDKNTDDSKPSEDFLCRICLDREKNQSTLIAPCKCTGSAKYVHEECLKTWIITCNQDMKSAFCDVCKENFTIEIQLKRTCTCKIIDKVCLKAIIFPFAILAISAVFAVIILYLVEGLTSGKLTSEKKTYFGLAISACSVILAILIWIYWKSVASTYCYMEISSWSIISIQPETVLGDTLEANCQEELNKEKKTDDLDYVSYEVGKYKGINSVVPVIQIDKAVEAASFISINHISQR